MLGQTLKSLRKQHKITQEVLASKLNLDKSTVASYETKGSKPSVDVLLKMSDIFGVSVDFLLTGKDREITAYNEIHSSIIKSNNSVLTIRNGEERELSEQEMEVLRIFGGFSQKQKAEALLHLYAMDEKNKNT